MKSKTVWPGVEGAAGAPLVGHAAQKGDGATAVKAPAEGGFTPVAMPMESRPARVLDLEGNCDPDAEPALAPEELLHFYEAMVRTRLFDTRAVNLHRQGRVGFFVPSFGEEAAQIGSIGVLEEGDWVFPQYRETGAAMFRGYPMERLIDQLLGNRDDLLKGRQMPNHFGMAGIRFAAASSPVGTQIPQAVGAAWAFKLRKEKNLALVYFGDGATSEGDFHAGMNFAGVFSLPTIFFCKNNGYAISMPVHRQTASPTLAIKAVAYGMPGIRVDGNDLLAVYKATKEAVRRARAGEGPTLIEAVTFRMGPHSTADDPTRYRDETEVEGWKSYDPIVRFRRYLEKKGLWDEQQDVQLRERLDTQIQQALAAAEKTAPPPLESLVEDVYATVPWHLKEELEEIRQAHEKTVEG
jgi:pyruvate dehydrogenase E1 component subunit alpha